MESLVTYNIFLKLSYVTLQVFELHVSDCAHILLFSLGISIYGTAWSYNNVKQLLIGMHISYRLVYNSHTLYIINDSILFLIIIHTVTYHSNPQSLHLSYLCFIFYVWCV